MGIRSFIRGIKEEKRIAREKAEIKTKVIEEEQTRLNVLKQAGIVDNTHVINIRTDDYDVFLSECLDGDVYIFTSEDGEASVDLNLYVANVFVNSPKTDALMITEDVDYYRTYYKPAFAPESILEYFYPGNIWALRGKAVKKASEIYKEYISSLNNKDKYIFVTAATILDGNTDSILSDDISLYHMPLKAGDKKCPKVIGGDEYKRIIAPLIENTDRWIMEDKFNPLISVIIPSKDNPDMLKECIESIKKDSYKDVEIVVVDNGSSEENKDIITKLSESLGFKYIYEKKDFNYSYMNNKGIKASKGEIILLLNDDVTLVSDSLEEMASMAMNSYIGAVGCKLLYPGTNRVQHIGVANEAGGAFHKALGANEDDVPYGGAVYNQNVIAVTGACLMARRSVLDSVNLLDEGLPVAYNDVDLCFKIYEKGYRNIVLNDIYMYHHESVSRGTDVMDDEKLKRLAQEREYLQNKHLTIGGSDPYYRRDNR